MKRSLLVVLSIVIACSAEVPSVQSWQSDVWFPLIGLAPNPDAANPESCEAALTALRERGGEVRPAPNPDLGDAAEAWVRRAETLMFDCSSEAEELDYQAVYEELLSLEAEVGALIATAP